MTLLVLLGGGPEPEPAPEYVMTTAFGDALYERLAPLAGQDEELGWPLLNFCHAIGSMFEEIDLAARTTDTAPGWASVLDADAAPAKWLGWLGQLGGVRRIAGLTDDEFRDRIKGADGWRRGTPASMRTAAAKHLTGSRRVTFRERNGGDPYAVTVITYTAETPDPAATAAAILEQKPAGLVLTCTVLDGWDYTELAGDYTGQDYDDLAGDFATYDDLNAKDI